MCCLWLFFDCYLFMLPVEICLLIWQYNVSTFSIFLPILLLSPNNIISTWFSTTGLVTQIRRTALSAGSVLRWSYRVVNRTGLKKNILSIVALNEWPFQYVHAWLTDVLTFWWMFPSTRCVQSSGTNHAINWLE